MGIISIKNLVHRFSKYGDNGEEIGEKTALEQVSLDIEKGSFVAILGHNGSGKSTLAKHLNALLLPTEGTVYTVSYTHLTLPTELYIYRTSCHPMRKTYGRFVSLPVWFSRIQIIRL